jgi:hypothetical protein
VQSLSEEITRSVGMYVIGQACVALLNGAFAFIVMPSWACRSRCCCASSSSCWHHPAGRGAHRRLLRQPGGLTVGWQTALLFAIPYLAYLQFEAYFISRASCSGPSPCRARSR